MNGFTSLDGAADQRGAWLAQAMVEGDRGCGAKKALQDGLVNVGESCRGLASGQQMINVGLRRDSLWSALRDSAAHCDPAAQQPPTTTAFAVKSIV